MTDPDLIGPLIHPLEDQGLSYMITGGGASVEYVVLRKLEYYDRSGSERHLREVSTILDVSGEMVDQAELLKCVDRLELQEARRIAEQLDPGF